MNKRIAVVVAASIYNRKGLFNAVHDRITHLRKVANYDVDAFVISPYKPFYICKLTGEKQIERPETITIDNISYRVLWIQNAIVDYILMHKLMRGPFISKICFKNQIEIFKDYDLIEAHACGEYIEMVHQKYGTKYTITWHGTDIHTTPHLSSYFFNQTRRLIEGASCNFFVSKALLDSSNEITTFGRKVIQYNGKDPIFKRYDDNKRLALREQYNPSGKKIVSFVGNLIPVKNVLLLPEIFRTINSIIQDVEFWVMGEGFQKSEFEAKTKNLPIKFWGNVDRNDMPGMLNATDLLVLPSKNEGLPLVTVEALSCGCNVVGSKVGGIPESIGEDFTVDLRLDNFNEMFAEKCVSVLNNPTIQILGDQFDWEKSAQLENRIISGLIN